MGIFSSSQTTNINKIIRTLKKDGIQALSVNFWTADCQVYEKGYLVEELGLIYSDIKNYILGNHKDIYHRGGKTGYIEAEINCCYTEISRNLYLGDEKIPYGVIGDGTEICFRTWCNRHPELYTNFLFRDSKSY